MGYFDGLVDGSFKTSHDGATLFYPNGIYGQGYVIPTASRKQEIRESLKRHTIMALATIIISGGTIFSLAQSFFVPLWFAAAVYLAIMAGLSFTANATIRELTHGLAPTEQKITVAEICLNSARSHDLLTLWALELVSLLLVLGGVLFSVDASEAWYLRLIGVCGALFFGACAVAIGYLIKVKKQGR